MNAVERRKLPFRRSRVCASWRRLCGLLARTEAATAPGLEATIATAREGRNVLSALALADPDLTSPFEIGQTWISMSMSRGGPTAYVVLFRPLRLRHIVVVRKLKTFLCHGCTLEDIGATPSATRLSNPANSLVAEYWY